MTQQSPVEPQGGLLQPTSGEVWARRALFVAFAAGFTMPYLNGLNRVEVHNGALLDQLPKRGVVLLSNHQTYFVEAITLFDVLYRKHRLRWEEPFLRFSAAEETMHASPATTMLKVAGAVTFRRSFRSGGVDLQRSVDFEGIGRIEQAIRSGWLLHFPTGTTRADAPIRSGVSRLLHSTQAIAVPMRVDGFRELLLRKQFPGRVGKRVSIRFGEPLPLADFYAAPYTPEAGAAVVELIGQRIGIPESGQPPQQ